MKTKKKKKRKTPTKYKSIISRSCIEYRSGKSLILLSFWYNDLGD